MSAADPAIPPAVPVAYLAAEGLVEPVLEALGDRVVGVRGRLVLASAPSDEAAWWSANTWLEPQWRRIASIGDGAKWLRSMQRNWACHAIDWFRRVELIVDKLPPLKAKPRPFQAAWTASVLIGFPARDSGRIRGRIQAQRVPRRTATSCPTASTR